MFLFDNYFFSGSYLFLLQICETVTCSPRFVFISKSDLLFNLKTYILLKVVTFLIAERSNGGCL